DQRAGLHVAALERDVEQTVHDDPRAHLEPERALARDGKEAVAVRRDDGGELRLHLVDDERAAELEGGRHVSPLSGSFSASSAPPRLGFEPTAEARRTRRRTAQSSSLGMGGRKRSRSSAGRGITCTAISSPTRFAAAAPASVAALTAPTSPRTSTVI